VFVQAVLETVTVITRQKKMITAGNVCLEYEQAQLLESIHSVASYYDMFLI
jgi:hypothetical protein